MAAVRIGEPRVNRGLSAWHREQWWGYEFKTRQLLLLSEVCELDPLC